MQAQPGFPRGGFEHVPVRRPRGRDGDEKWFSLVVVDGWCFLGWRADGQRSLGWRASDIVVHANEVVPLLRDVETLGPSDGWMMDG